MLKRQYEDWEMTAVLTMDITDDHGKSCLSRAIRARAAWNRLKDKWEVSKLDCVGKERQRVSLFRDFFF